MSQCKASRLQMIGSNIFIKHGQHVLFVRVNSSEKVTKANFQLVYGKESTKNTILGNN